jgi:hypothetical protein
MRRKSGAGKRRQRRRRWDASRIDVLVFVVAVDGEIQNAARLRATTLAFDSIA